MTKGCLQLCDIYSLAIPMNTVVFPHANLLSQLYVIRRTNRSCDPGSSKQIIPMIYILSLRKSDGGFLSGELISIHLLGRYGRCIEREK